MEAEGSLTVAQPKGTTQCSVGHSNCLNMPKTGGREDTDLDEMALEVLKDTIQLDMETDEPIYRLLLELMRTRQV